jgi:CheY-like chemotaxis protein
LRILVAEDNQDSAESMRALLEMLGHEVTVAQNGSRVLQVATEWPPHVVFSDIGLPGMNCYELAAELRRNPATAKTHLIAITGYGQDGDRRRCQEVGFDHHLLKPVQPHVLQSVLALQMLAPHNGEAAAPGKKLR